MKSLKIAIISPPYESVPPKRFGAIELVVYNLVEQLVKNGHKVYLLATGNSKTSAELLPYLPKSFREYSESQFHKLEEKLTLLCVGRILKYLNKLEVDIVHNHCGTMIVPFLDSITHPMITTLHAPIGFYNKYSKMIYEHFKNANYVSVSHNQRNGMPDLNYVGTVYNGIRLEDFKLSNKKGNYFAFLGRTSPEKGIKEAIIVSKKTGVKLKIAAKSESDKEYFEKEVKPLIDGKQIEYIGEISSKDKSNFLGNAIALLSPIQWEEPFGLVFIEAMACGTPIIAFNRGSVPEIINHGKTGFIIEKNNIENMVEAVKELTNMHTDEYKKMILNCRKQAEKNFTAEKMADAYEKVYLKILGK